MIRSNHYTARAPSIRLLSEDDIRSIHQAAIRILEQTGFKILHEGARKMLKSAGAMVKGDIVYIPRFIVQECLRTAPKGFDLFDRNGNLCMSVEGNNTFYGTSTASPRTRDAITHDIHETRIADMALGAKVADACENIDYVMPMGTAQDVPQACAELYEFEAVVQNTTKPVCFCAYSPKGHERVIEMAAEVAGGIESLQARPFILSYPEPITPLVYPGEIIEKIFTCARYRIPVIPGSAPQMGGTGPATVAGTVALTIAESLMGLMLVQLKQPGAPMLFGGSPTTFDMASGYMTYGAPETHLMFIGYTEVAHWYGLPTWGLAGATDSKMIDAQAGIDVGISMTLQGLAGVNIIHDSGYMDSGMACSTEMLVMGNEVAGLIKRFARGVEVTEENLALGVIDQVGHGGHFLQHPHTFKAFKEHMWRPKLLIRTPYENWEKKGKKSMETRIQERLSEIIDTHRPDPLDDKIIQNLEKMRVDGEKALVRHST